MTKSKTHSSVMRRSRPLWKRQLGRDGWWRLTPTVPQGSKMLSMQAASLPPLLRFPVERVQCQLPLHAGVFTIEHGSFMTEDLAKQLSSLGRVYIPTCTITQVFNATNKPEEISNLSWEKGKSLLRDHHEAVKTAIANNVTIVAGTDCP